jgi:poly(hydroxyalkanoate) depolymerase family esterase
VTRLLLAASVLLAPAPRAHVPLVPARAVSPDSVAVSFVELASSPVGARRYRLAVPTGDTRAPRPLLVVLHGCTQDAADIARGSRLDRAAAERGWLVAYAEQPASANPRRCWNWFDPAHQRRDAGEPALVAAIVDDVARRHRVDASRTWLVGISAGAAMAGIVALAYPERIAGVVMHSGLAVLGASTALEAVAQMQQGVGDAAPSIAAARARLGAAPVPAALVIHGETDPVVRAANGVQLAAQWRALANVETPTDDAHVPRDARVTARAWRAAGGTVPRVAHWQVAGLAHAWSGGDSAGSWTDPAAPDIVPALLDWLAAHPRP